MSLVPSQINLTKNGTTASIVYSDAGQLITSGASLYAYDSDISIGEGAGIQSQISSMQSIVSSEADDIAALNQAVQVPAKNTLEIPSIQITNGGSINFQSRLFTNGDINIKDGRRITVSDANNTNLGALIMPDANTLNIDCADGSGVVNIIASELQLNGVPVGGGGGNPALDECFSVPVEATFTSQPILITSIDAESCDLSILKGGSLTVQSLDTGDNAVLTLGDSSTVSLSGQSAFKVVNSDLVVNHGSRNLNLAIEDTYGTASFTGAGTYSFDSTILCAGNGLAVQGNGDALNIQSSYGRLNAKVDAGNHCAFSALDGASDFTFDKPVYSNSELVQTSKYGNTASRPSSPLIAQQYWDSTIAKLVIWTGAQWVDTMGAIA